MKINMTSGLKWTLVFAVLGGAWLNSCDQGTDVVGIGGSSVTGNDDDSTKKKKKNSKKGEDGVETDDKESVINIAGFDKPGSVEDNGNGAPIEYPNMDFLGNGITTCKGDTYPTKVQFFSKLYVEKLELNMYAASLKADKGKAEDKANAKIAESTGITNWVRPTKEEKSKHVADGFDWASYAIFAKSVTKERQGQTYEFSKPIPVFPWPAPPTRFEELEKGPKSWTAQVTGSDTFTVTVTLTLISTTGDEVRLKLQTEIAEDQPGTPNHRARYEAFPLPREATYTINAGSRDVRQIENVSWFHGDECNGLPESVTMNYKLCRKSTTDKDEQFPCE